MTRSPLETELQTLLPSSLWAKLKAYHLQMSFMAGNLSEETIDTLTSRLENSGPKSAGWPHGWTEEDSKALKDQCQPGGRGPWHLLPFNFA